MEYGIYTRICPDCDARYIGTFDVVPRTMLGQELMISYCGVCTKRLEKAGFWGMVRSLIHELKKRIKS